MELLGLLAGYCTALLIIMGIDKWKEKKEKEESYRTLDTHTKLWTLSEEESNEAYEKYIAHNPNIHDWKDLRKAWEKAVDKAFEKHVKKVSRGE